MAGKTAILSLKIIGDATSAQKAAAKTEKSISGMEKAMGGINKSAKWAGAAAGGALLLGLDSALAADKAQRGMSAAMGLDPAETEAAGKMAGDLYKNAYGESMEQVTDTIKGVGSTLADMSSNGGADVERLTKKALDLAAAFPEVGDGVATAGILMTTGLAGSADEAYDLMVGTLQKMPAAMQAELMPVMDEYATHFAALGISGETAFGIMGQAAENGAIGMDKAGDALKELTIRATDGSPGTVAAYEAMGLSSEDMAGKMVAGGDDAAEAFGTIVAGLQGIEDPVEQSTAALALFGTPLEDLGVSKIPEFLGAIDPMGDAFDSTAGAAERMGETLSGGPAVGLETLKRTALDAFTQIGASALPVLEPIIGVLTQYAPVIGPIVVILGIFAAIVWVVNGALTAWSVIQGIVNAVMAANPIMIVVLAIVALVAIIILAYNNIGWFKDAVNLAGEIAGAVFTAIGDFISTVVDWVKDVILESETFQTALNVIGDIAGTVFGGINDAIAGTIGWVQDAIGWFQGLFGAKDEANSVSVDGGGAGSSGGFSLPAPAMATATAGPALLAEPTAGPAAALVSSIGALGARRNAAPARNVTIKVEFKGLVTDRLGVAREIRKILADEAALTGADA